jgi:chloramphenicol-sensitive protein RarD
MPVARWIGFGLIWVALAVMTVDALRRKPVAESSGDVDLPAPESSSR